MSLSWCLPLPFPFPLSLTLTPTVTLALPLTPTLTQPQPQPNLSRTRALTRCLCCGGASPIGYFYCTYFAILLIHRAARDDHMCAQKYGADWQRYKQKVPALFIPGLV